MKQEKLEELLETAKAWAETLHAGQTYAYGEDYFSSHVQEVVNTVKLLTREISYTKTERFLVQIVAYLHDVVEYTQATTEDIRATFGRDIAEKVLLLTKNSGESLETQWAKSTRDPISMVVKKAEILVNLRTSIANKRLNLVAKNMDGLDYICFKSNC